MQDQVTVEQRFNEAVALHQAGDLQGAVAAYTDVLQLDRTHKIAFNNLGTALKAMKRFDEAIASYMSALAIDPTYAAAIYNLGTAYQATGDLIHAFRLYSMANELRPDDANTLYNMAVLADHGQLFDLGAALFQRVIDLMPDHQRAMAGRASCLGQMGRFEQAMEQISQLIANHPDEPRYWCLAGEICLDSEDWERACHYLQQALALAPMALDARMELAYAFYRQQLYADVVVQCDAVLQVSPGYCAAHVLRSKGLEGLGRMEEAAQAADIGKKLPGVASTWLDQALKTATMAADNPSIAHSRKRYFAALDNAVALGGQFQSGLDALARTPFYFAYQGRDERPLMEKLAETMRALCLDLNYVAPHCRELPSTNR